MTTDPTRRFATRRQFLQASAASGAAIGLFGMGPLLSAASGAVQPADRKLRILILGGTGFLGPHIVRHAMARGHTMTLFNRGRSNPHLFPDVEKLVGDRNDDLEALKDRTWDAVIDTNSGYPLWVRSAGAILAPNVEHYVFISSISVYSDLSKKGVNEHDPVYELEGDEGQRITGANYGGMKARCESVGAEIMDGRFTTIRPGLIVGEGDNYPRFTYWPVRINAGGDVLAPGDGTEPVQFIDVRDLAEFVVTAIEKRAFGKFNATGPNGGMPMKKMLQGVRRGVESDASFVWIPYDFLQSQGVQAWAHMPAWTPSEGGFAGMGAVDVSKAIALGLSFRPLEDTARATLEWANARPEEQRTRDFGNNFHIGLPSGLSAAKEAEVLEAWRAHKKEQDTDE
jgi:2'-hydroxyisoflavone reductase